MQYHGNESSEFCDSVGLPYIKAFRVRPDINILAEMERYPNASDFLLDAYVEGRPGGTGERFDWGLIPKTDRTIILAGGLTPENAKDAIECVAPWALDVSGGIETEPGRKDLIRCGALLARVATNFENIMALTEQELRTLDYEPDTGGHFGDYGGCYVSETLMAALNELDQSYQKLKNDQTFNVSLMLILLPLLGGPLLFITRSLVKGHRRCADLL